MAGQKKKRNNKWFDIGRENILSLLFPHRCPVCDEILEPEEIEKGIHLFCESKLYPVGNLVCMHCGRPFGHEKSLKERQYDHLKRESVKEYCEECYRKGYVHQAYGIRSAVKQGKALFVYKGVIKQSMYRFKYANKREYAVFFARLAAKKYAEWLQNVEVIVPVPMYPPKQKERGYNQAETFAKELSKCTGIPVDLQCVCRVKDTTPQKELRDVERKNNLKNAFQKEKNIVQYSHILIVDDIYTTGYTAEAVAEELRKQGGRQIFLLSICIGGND